MKFTDLKEGALYSLTKEYVLAYTSPDLKESSEIRCHFEDLLLFLGFSSGAAMFLPENKILSFIYKNKKIYMEFAERKLDDFLREV